MNELNPVPASPTNNTHESEYCKGGRNGHSGHHRRNFFKVLVFGALLFAIVAAGVYVGKSNARPVGPGSHAMWQGNFEPASADERIEVVVSFALANVDATAEQKARISDIAQGALEDLMPMHESHKAAHDQAVTLLTAATIDRAAMEQLRANELHLVDTVSKRVTQAIADAADVLQPAQRAKLADNIKRHMARNS